jgi:hypothetical protein
MKSLEVIPVTKDKEWEAPKDEQRSSITSILGSQTLA